MQSGSGKRLHTLFSYRELFRGRSKGKCSSQRASSHHYSCAMTACISPSSQHFLPKDSVYCYVCFLHQRGITEASDQKRRWKATLSSDDAVRTQRRLRRLLELAEDVLVTEQVELVRAELDERAAVLWEQHLVADGALHWDQSTLDGAGARADRDDFAFVLLLVVGVREVDAAGRLFIIICNIQTHSM